MQPFADSINPPKPGPGVCAAFHDAPDQCAALLVEIIPRFMQALRLSIACAENPALSVPQFRALHFVHSRAGANLSAAAEFLGLTLPSTSKLVDLLVRRKLLARHSDSVDRRRMTLRITPKGDALLSGARESVRRHLAGTLSRLGATELFALHNALGILQANFPVPAVRMDGAAGGNTTLSPPMPVTAAGSLSTP